jgi:hypothetical protein
MTKLFPDREKRLSMISLVTRRSLSTLFFWAMKVPGLGDQKRTKMCCGMRPISVNAPNFIPPSSQGMNMLTYSLVGISWLTKKEASHLLNKTLPAPHDSDKYMIQLEVFHNLHCLNMLRKSLYPDQYPEMWEYHENGTVNHNTLQSLHMGESALHFLV